MKLTRRRSSPDSGLRVLFRRHVPPPVHWTSVETGGTVCGVPDSNYAAEGTEGWIEYKRTAGWTCPLEDYQVVWIAKHVREGGRVLIATRRLVSAGSRRSAADELWIHSGEDARVLRRDGLLARKPLGQWAGGPRRWDWNAVRVLMI